MASAPQELTKSEAPPASSGSAHEPKAADSFLSRFMHGRGKWMALLSISVVLLSVAGLFQKPHPDAYRVVHTMGFDSRSHFSGAGLRDWLIHPSERHAFLRMPAISSQVRDICVAPNSLSIWIVGDHGMVLHSADDGVSWVKQTLPDIEVVQQKVLDIGQDIPPPPKFDIAPSQFPTNIPNRMNTPAPNQQQDNTLQLQRQRPGEGDTQPNEDSAKEMAPPKSNPKKVSQVAPRASSQVLLGHTKQSLLVQHTSNATYIAAPPPEENDSQRPSTKGTNTNLEQPSAEPPPSNTAVPKPSPAPAMRLPDPPVQMSDSVAPVPQEETTTSKKINVTAVSFFDNMNGWLVADVENNRGDYVLVFFHTTDAGKNWKQVAPKVTLYSDDELILLRAMSNGRAVCSVGDSTICHIDALEGTVKPYPAPVSLLRNGLNFGLLHSGRWYFVDKTDTTDFLVKGQVSDSKGVSTAVTGLDKERINEMILGEDETGLATTHLGNIVRIGANGSSQHVKLPYAVVAAGAQNVMCKLLDSKTIVIQFSPNSGYEHIISRDSGESWETMTIQRGNPLLETAYGHVTVRGTVFCFEFQGKPSFIARDNVLRTLSRENGFVMMAPLHPGSLLAVSGTVVMRSTDQGKQWDVISRRNHRIKVPQELQQYVQYGNNAGFSSNSATHEEYPWHFQWDPPLPNSTLPCMNLQSLPALPESVRAVRFLTTVAENIYCVVDNPSIESQTVFTCRTGDTKWTQVKFDPDFKGPMVACGVSHVASSPALRIVLTNAHQYDIVGTQANPFVPPSASTAGGALGPARNAFSNLDLKTYQYHNAHLAFVSPTRIILSHQGMAVLESSDNGLSWAPPSVTPADVVHFDRAIYPSPTLAVAPDWDGTFRYSSDSATTWSQSDARILPYRKLPAPWYWLAMSVVCVFLVPRVVRRPAPIAAGRPMIETVAISDAPLQPGQPDHLGLLKLSRGISLFLRNSNTKTPLTVAIEAPWGAGKSSLMNLLAKDLKDNGCRTAWFNAWHHQGEESLLAALLETIRTGVNPPVWTMQGLVFRYRLWWRRFQNAMTVRPLPILGLLAVFCASAGVMWWSKQNPSPPTSPYKEVASDSPTALGKSDDVAIVKSAVDAVSKFFIDMGLMGVASKISLVVSFIFLALPTLRAMTAIGISPSKLLASAAGSMKPADLEAQTSFRVRFAKQFQEVTDALEPESKLVIFIDDIDRCSENVVAQTLQACNYLVTSGRCIIVLGMDAAYVRACVRRTYGGLLEQVEVEKKKDGDTKITDFASNYLEKLINIRITLPRVTTDTVKGLTTGKKERVPQHIHLLRRIPSLAGMAMVLFFVGLTAIGMGYSGWLFAPTLFRNKAVEPIAMVIQTPQVTLTGGANQQTVVQPVEPAQQTLVVGRRVPQLVDPGQRAPHVFWIPWIIALGLGICLTLIVTRRRVVLPVDSAAWTEAINAMSTALVYNRHSTPREIKRIMNRLRFDAMRLRAEAPQSEWWTPFIAFWRKIKAWRTPASKQQLNNPGPLSDKDNLNDQAIAVFGMLRDAYPNWLKDDEFWAKPASFATSRLNQGKLSLEALAYLRQHTEILDKIIPSLRTQFEEISLVGASNVVDVAVEPKDIYRAPGHVPAQLDRPAEHSA